MIRISIVEQNFDKIKAWLAEGFSIYKISQFLNCDKGSLSKSIKKHGLSSTHRDKHAYSLELNKQIDNVSEMFKTKNIAEIAKDIGCSSKAIHNLLKKKDPDIDTSKYSRDYTVDESYFEKIDTHNKAYFLGMMYADGCVQESGIKIKLQDRDEHILNDLKNDIGYTGPLSYAEKANERCQDVASLVINRVKIVQDLIKLGATPRKSLTITLPTFDQVPEEFFPSFIRGLFDGDGSIAVKGLQKTIVNCYITGNDLLLKPLMEYFNTIGLNSTGFYYHKNSNGHTGMLCFTKKAEAIKFLNYIYKDATLKLNRKYEKALPFLLP